MVVSRIGNAQMEVVLTSAAACGGDNYLAADAAQFRRDGAGDMLFSVLVS